MAQAVAGGAGFDDGSAVGEAVDDRGAQAGVGEGLGPPGDDFVAIAQRADWGCETTDIIATHFGVEYPERPPR